jgi:SNF2-related domain
MIRNPYVKQLSSKVPPQIPHSLASGQKRTERRGDEINIFSTDAAKEDKTTGCTAKSNDTGGKNQKWTPKTIHNNSNAERKILHPLSTFETIAPAELSQPIRREDSVPNKPFPAATTSPFCSVPIDDLEPIDTESSSLVPLAQQHPPMRLQSQAVGNKSSISASLLTLPRPPLWNSKGAALSRPPGSPSSSVGTTDVDPLQLSLPRELQFTLDVTQPIQDEHRADLVRNAALSEPLCNGWTLYSHQKRAILVSLLMRRHILALDMGLGKTLIGCCWARAFYRTIPNIHIIVLCPVSLKEEWHRTSQDIAGLIVRSDEMNHKSKRKRTAHDSLDDDDSNSRGVVTIVSWAKIPSPDEVLWDRDQHYVVVADEAHSMQNMSSARTRDALRLMLAPNAKGVLLLTGTPVCLFVPELFECFSNI